MGFYTFQNTLSIFFFKASCAYGIKGERRRDGGRTSTTTLCGRTVARTLRTCSALASEAWLVPKTYSSRGSL